MPLAHVSISMALWYGRSFLFLKINYFPHNCKLLRRARQFQIVHPLKTAAPSRCPRSRSPFKHAFKRIKNKERCSAVVGCRSRLTSWPFLRSTSSKETLRKRDDAFWGGRTRKKEEELSSPSMDGPSDIFLNSATLALSIGWIIVAHLSLSLPTVVVREIYSQRIPSHYMLKKIYTRQAENKTTRSVARTTPLAVRLHRSTSALV